MRDRVEATLYAMSLLDELVDYGFDRANPESISRIDLPDDVNWDGGATRLVVWRDGADYVIKMPLEPCDEKYCAREVEIYDEAPVDIAEYFGWCIKVLDAEENCGIGVYAMEFLCCDEEGIDDDSVERAYQVYCEETDSNADDDDVRDAFMDEYWDSDWCSSAPLEFLLSRIRDLDRQRELQDFIESEDISDLHVGNFGYRDDTLVIADYASYGW